MSLDSIINVSISLALLNFRNFQLKPVLYTDETAVNSRIMNQSYKGLANVPFYTKIIIITRLL
jgi:hypothetical protein